MERARGRGRPRSFDLDAATEAFEALLWSNGYRATSVEDLARHAGLSPSSLYAAYGSKEGVLHAALVRYEREMSTALEVVEGGRRGLPDVMAFVDRVRRALESDPDPRGCLMVNTMVELGETIPEVAALTRAYRSRLEDGLAAALRRGAAEGQIPASTVADRARVLQVGLFGALTIARAGDRGAAIDALASLRREIRRWASPAP